MSPFIIGLFILGCGVIFGAMLAWWYMSGRVEFWQEKFIMERRLKENLLQKNMEILGNQLRIINDISGVIQGKGK